MNYTNQAASILKAWIALEVLSSQGYKKLADLARMENLKCVWLKGGQLPWHELRLQRGMAPIMSSSLALLIRG